MGDQQNNRILRVFGILDENPLADVIDKRVARSTNKVLTALVKQPLG